MTPLVEKSYILTYLRLTHKNHNRTTNNLIFKILQEFFYRVRKFSCTLSDLTNLGILIFRLNIDVSMLFLHESSVVECFICVYSNVFLLTTRTMFGFLSILLIVHVSSIASMKHVSFRAINGLKTLIKFLTGIHKSIIFVVVIFLNTHIYAYKQNTKHAIKQINVAQKPT